MYYKYKSLENIKFVIDIILNERLYAAKYNELNDPMEGIYKLPDFLSRFDINRIYEEKQRIGIVSLTTKYNNPLMWSHYSNGFKGIVVGLELENTNNLEVKKVNYDFDIFNITNRTHTHRMSAEEVLRNKLFIWKYEDEKRILTYDEEYVKIKIKKIIFGYRVSKLDKEIITGLVNLKNTSRDNHTKIELRTLLDYELDYSR